MRKLLAVLLVTSLVIPFVNGQGTPRGRMVPVPQKKAEAKPESAEKPASEEPKRRSLFQRMFGPFPTPTPIPRPKPTPTPIAKKRYRPKPQPAPSAETTEPSVASTKPAPAPKATPAPAKPKTTAARSSKTPSADATGLDDPTKFKAAKAKAAEDAAIKDLKAKADGEVNEVEAQKALAAYNRALFRKIREIDPSVSEYTDRVEESMTKRLGAEKGTQ